MVTGADNWFMFNFRIHCKDLVEHRIQDVDMANQFADEVSVCSDMRKLVLELCQPLFNSKRIINMDNLYGSPQLFEQLYLKGLYGRGTMRMNRQHVPSHLVFSRRDLAKYPRGSYRIGVCSVGVNRPLVFASWLDGSVVNVLSNADSSGITAIQRKIGAKTRSYDGPEIVREYNTYMQGVDRVDQLRSRFSLADGHSFRKYYKKLALGIIDLARVNAYKARAYVLAKTGGTQGSKRRDPHRTFIVDLSRELIFGAWKKSPRVNILDNDSDVESSSSSVYSSASLTLSTPCTSDQTIMLIGKCTTSENAQSVVRRKRQCVVCRWENRIVSVNTLRDHTHNVSLCVQVRTGGVQMPYMCPYKEWTCWRKYHDFYLPHCLYNLAGNMKTSSELYKLRKASEGNDKKLRF